MPHIHAVVGINISVGNAAVQSTDDIADLLRQLAGKVDLVTLQEIADGPSVKVFDVNGNTVGSLQVTGYYETPEDGDEED